jgi:predicted MFS family arabinose efflux permease
LLGFGIANFIGTSVASYLLSRSLRLTLALVPLMMSVLALLMVTFGHLTVLDGLLVALWGFAFGLVPVAWSTWLATTVPDEAESAGGLLVASIQLAISAGPPAAGRCLIARRQRRLHRQRSAAVERDGDCLRRRAGETGRQRRPAGDGPLIPRDR